MNTSTIQCNLTTGEMIGLHPYYYPIEQISFREKCVIFLISKVKCIVLSIEKQFLCCYFLLLLFNFYAINWCIISINVIICI